MNRTLPGAVSPSGVRPKTLKVAPPGRSATPPPTYSVNRTSRVSQSFDSSSDNGSLLLSTSNTRLTSRPTSPSITKAVNSSNKAVNSPAKYRTTTPPPTIRGGNTPLKSKASPSSNVSKIEPISTPSPSKDPELYDKNGRIMFRSPSAQKAFLRPALIQLGEARPKLIASGAQTIETIDPNHEILFISAKEVELLKSERKDSDALIEETVATIELIKSKVKCIPTNPLVLDIYYLCIHMHEYLYI